MELDARKSYLSGYKPGVTIQKLLNVSGPQAGAVIDKPENLNKMWRTLGLGGYDKPPIDWQKEVMLLVAQERTDGGNAIPQGLTYNRYSSDLDIYLKSDKGKGAIRASPGIWAKSPTAWKAAASTAGNGCPALIPARRA